MRKLYFKYFLKSEPFIMGNNSVEIEARKLRVAAMVSGAKDPNQNNISYVYSKYENFVIYEIETNNIYESLKFYVDADESDPSGVISNLLKIKIKYNELKAVFYKVNNFVILKSRVANIVSIGLNGGLEQATSYFDLLIKEINEEYANQFKYKLQYLITALVFTFLIISCALFIYCTQERINYFQQIKYLTYIMAGASLGGFLSVSGRLKKTIFEEGVKGYMYVIYSIERMFIALFAGVIMYFAINSNLIIGMVNSSNNRIYNYILFAIVAGFSETLVPNLLIKIETKQDGK